MSTATAEKLRNLLQDFDSAMLVTGTDAGCLRSRPMAVASVDDDGTMWFMTQRHSGKIEEIEHDSHVNVALQKGGKFVSVSGSAVAVDDRAKITELWNDSWKTWFPKGKDDPALVLLKIYGEEGEYWDNSTTSGLKYLIKAGAAYLRGTTPDVEHDPDIHGKVQMPR